MISKNIMEIRSKDTDQLIVRHKISQEKAKLVQIEGHDREKRKNYANHEIYEKTLKLLECTEKAKEFIEILRVEKTRHFKEQCMLIIDTVKNQDI